MKRQSQRYWWLVVTLLVAGALGESQVRSAETITVTDKLFHLRIAGEREWSEFPKTPDAAQLSLRFRAVKNPMEWTLRLRQQDVKQTWNVVLNGKRLGRLRIDENDMIVYFAIPTGGLKDGANQIIVEQDVRRRRGPDDIRAGQVAIIRRPKKNALTMATLRINVREATKPIPARITIVDEQGVLQSVGATSNVHLAVRPGTVYTSSGQAEFGVPAGRYTIFAGRGFEYSLAKVRVSLTAGQQVTKTLNLRREVGTDGYVACDPHVHTLTHSGHGDATVGERMITLAGEGIELPIATDHNRHVNHDLFARRAGVRKYFTPVIGNEVTTKTGHFNIFPVKDGSPIPQYRSTDWGVTLSSIFKTPGVKVAILNHARDLHGGTRPFGPKLFNDAAGDNTRGWPMRFNAMEVVNSAATQTDVLQLFRDWMSLLNRGYAVTPVGSSDSHDVGRHFVGQGRTYIRCDDRDPANINVNQAVSNFLAGKVLVSYGLLAELTVDNKWRSGELADKLGKTVRISVRVRGPHWTRADRVLLYSNGVKIREKKLSPERKPRKGIHWEGHWKIARPAHDVHLVAIALGPGIDGLYWKTAKPYQPTSPQWKAQTIGCSGAVWLDGDGDRRKSSAAEYAERLVKANGDLGMLLQKLLRFDRAVAAQAARLYHNPKRSLLTRKASRRWKAAAPETRAGFKAYLDAWQKTQRANQR